ncbi:MAG TPA: hypothetical protein PLI09_11195 [Candidatus Hydrogenedentes bacterium]|nr:hypothetical protein [Candidatus Hydrogenedentota bacterium]
MQGKPKQIVQKCLSYVVRAFGILTRVLPLPVSRVIAVTIGRLAYHLIPRIKKVGFANLDLAFGDAVPQEHKRRIVKGVVRNLAIVAAEFAHMPRLAKRQYKGYVTIKGMEHCDFTKGFLAIGGHLGNWEWMASVLSSHGYKTAEIVRPFDDPVLNDAIDRTRQAAQIRTIPKDEAGADVIRLLKEGWIVGVLIDQSPRHNAVPVTFFGESCWATIAPVMVAVRAKVPIHPVSMFRDAKGKYTLQFYPALEINRSGNLRQDIVTNTQQCQDFFENLVRVHPDQWLWLHRRWKHRERLQREWEHRVLRDGQR